MKNFYLLYGTDNSVIKNELDNLIKKLNISDKVKYEIDNNSLQEVIEDASTISMFSNKKIIVIDNCNFFSSNKNIDNINLLENYLENYNSDTYIIFISHNEKVDTRKKIYKLLNKNGTIIECNKEDNKYITNYINNYLKENNYTMENIKYFIDIVGSNLDNIKNELDKLFMYKLEDKTILNKDIDKITIKNMEEEIFSLTDSIIANNINKSLNLLNEFLNKSYDEIAILMLLASQFRFLLQVKILINKNLTYQEIAKILEVNPYRVKFTINKLYNYTEYNLKNRIKQLANIDRDIKLGLTDKKMALELFIINKS